MEFGSVGEVFKHIKSNEYLPVYILHGTEAFFIDEIVNHLFDNVLSEAERSFNQSILYGREVDFKTVVDHASQYPMMSDKRLVIVKEAQNLRSLDKLTSYFSNPLDSTVLVIAHANKKIDGRAKWLKEAKKNSKIGLFHSESVKEYKLEQWVSEYLHKAQIKIKPAANVLLCEYLGNDLKRLVNELNKITLNVTEGEAIDVGHVEKYVGISKSYNVYELLSEISKRNTKRISDIVANMTYNMHLNPMPMITASFHQHFIKVLIAHQNSHLSDQHLAGLMRINPYFVKEYRVACNSYSVMAIRKALKLIRRVDAMSKGVGKRRAEPANLLKSMVGELLLLR